MDNGIWHQLMRVEGHKRIARLPLELKTPISKVQNNASMVRFEMKLLDEGAPENWDALIIPHETYILTVFPGLDHPVQAAKVIDTVTTGKGVIQIDAVTFEYDIDNWTLRQDIEVTNVNLTTGFGVELFTPFAESFSMRIEAVPSTWTVSRFVDAVEGRKLGEVAKEQRFFYSVDPQWLDADKSEVELVLSIYPPEHGRSDNPNVGLILQGDKGNIASHTRSGPVNAEKFATHLWVVGPDPETVTPDAVNPSWREGKPMLPVPVPAPDGMTDIDEMIAYRDWIAPDFFTRHYTTKVTVRESPTCSLNDFYRLRASARLALDQSPEGATHKVQHFAGYEIDHKTLIVTADLIDTPKESPKFLTPVSNPFSAGQKVAKLAQTVTRNAARMNRALGTGSGSSSAPIKYAVIKAVSGIDYAVINSIYGDKTKDVIARNDTGQELIKRRIVTYAKNDDGGDMPSILTMTHRFLIEEIRKLGASPFWMDAENALEYGPEAIASGRLQNGVVIETTLKNADGDSVYSFGNVNPAFFQSFDSNLYTWGFSDNGVTVYRLLPGGFQVVVQDGGEIDENDPTNFPVRYSAGRPGITTPYGQLRIVRGLVTSRQIPDGQATVDIEIKASFLDPILDAWGNDKTVTISPEFRTDTTGAVDLSDGEMRQLSFNVRGNKDHAYFELQMGRLGPNYYELNLGLFYFDMSGSGTITRVGDSFAQYLGITGAEVSTSLAVSESGTVFSGLGMQLRYRNPGDSSYGSYDLSQYLAKANYAPTITGVLQRAESGDYMLIVEEHELSYAAGSYAVASTSIYKLISDGSALIEVDSVTGQDTTFSFGPVQLPTGDVIANIATGTTNKMVRTNW